MSRKRIGKQRSVVMQTRVPGEIAKEFDRLCSEMDIKRSRLIYMQIMRLVKEARNVFILSEDSQ